MAQKKRRINVKFIGIGVVILMALGVIGYVLKKTVLRPNPQKYVALAKADMEAGRWDKAVENLGAAIKYARLPDPGPWVMLGDACMRRTATEKDAYDQGRNAWNTALEIDPGNKDALKRLLGLCKDYLLTPSRRTAGDYDAIEKLTQKALAADPKDPDAQYVATFATVDRWFHRLETDPKRRDEALRKLQEIHEKNPADATVVSMLLQAKLIDASDALRAGGDRKLVKRIGQDAEGLLNSSLAGQENNASMQYRVATGWRVMAAFEVETFDRNASTTKSSSRPSQRDLGLLTSSEEGRAALARMNAYLKRYLDTMAKAAELTKPQDLDYAEIRQACGEALEATDVMPDVPMEQRVAAAKERLQKAEAVYRETLKQRPGEQQVRLALAELLTKPPPRIPDAIALLEEKVPVNDQWVGLRGNDMVRNYEEQVARKLCDLRLDQIELTRDKTERDKLLAETQADYDKANVLSAALGRGGENNPQVLHLKGRIQIAKGQGLDAIQTLSRALNIFPEAEHPAVVRERVDLMRRLGNLYAVTQQTGEAKRLFRQILQIQPGNLQVRLALAELLMKEQSIKGPDGVEGQVNVLEQAMGAQNPLVMRMRLFTLDKEKDKKKIDELYANLPETTASERVDKAQLAVRFDRVDDAIRLLEQVRKENPNDVALVQLLANVYLNNKQDRAAAAAMIKDAIAKNPEAKGLPALLQRVEDPEAYSKGQLEQIQKIQDPLRRNLALAEVARRQGQEDECYKYLLEAEKLAADNAQVMQGLFRQALMRRDWDRAKSLTDKLSQKNADGAGGQRYRIELATGQGNLDAAYDEAVKLTQTRAELADSWVVLGRVLQLKGRYDEAISAYQQAQAKQTENLDALKNLIDCYVALNRPGKPSAGVGDGEQKATDAKLYIEMGQRMYPEMPLFKELALRWEVRYGDPRKAIAPREAAVKSNPENPEAWDELGDAYVFAAKGKQGASLGAEDSASERNRPALSPEEQKKQDQLSQEFLTKARDTFTQAAAKFPDLLGFSAKLADADLQLKDIPAAEKVYLDLVGKDRLKGTWDGAALLADFYVKAALPEKAEQALRQFVSANPTNVQAQARLAQHLTNQKKFDDALKVLDSANADDPSVLRQRVDTLLLSGRFDDAAKVVDAMLASKPSPGLTKLRAKIDIASGKLAEGRARIAEVLQTAPDDVEALYLRGLVSLADPRGDVIAATEDLNRVIAQVPNLVDARAKLAEAFQRRNMLSDAIRTMEIAAVMSPGDRDLRLKLLEMYSDDQPPRWGDAERLVKDTRSMPQFSQDMELMRAEVGMWLQRKETTRALDLIRQMIKQAPDNLQNVGAYYNVLSEAKEYRTLAAETDKMVKAKPDLWWVYQYRAVARKRGANDRNGAAADLNAGLSIAIKNNDAGGISSLVEAVANEIGVPEARKVLQPLAEKDPHWRMVEADMLNRHGDPPNALAAAEQALASPSLSAKDLEQALKMAGYLYMTQSPPKTAQAIDIYKRLLKEIPNEPTALNNLGYLLVEDGPSYAPNEAVKYSTQIYEKAVRDGKKEELPFIMDTHGWALVLSGKVDEGIDLLRKALEKKSIPDTHYHLGKAFLLKNPPSVVDAERSLLDAKQAISEAERAGKPIYGTLKVKVDQALADVKAMKSGSAASSGTGR